MEHLERQYYDEQYITPAAESYAWYSNRPHSFTVLAEQTEMIGFMCLFPVTSHVYNELSEGTFNDKFMTYEDIIDVSSQQPSKVNLFLSCIVVDGHYRGRGAVQHMLQHYCAYYESLEKLGWKFEEVITDNVTEAGQRFSQKYGFQKLTVTKHDSFIYTTIFENLCLEVNCI
ncbi:GNAT family N-acetyltransferase [Paenibacillus arenosi]|uniref:GNAT family N-acetyltransferase n=1 Tax=Paenibacillus arenosi TaxID=2774142 RepID=A0ABR9B0T4_9BACL|nr:GNAT family N-acetyltransferase [Paenibacillus arenosi]MBD8499934.1 GNAT family N-acetyltransferase [Paenibacillus arenosi]